MTLQPADFAAIVGYFILMAILGFLTRRTRNFGEFAVGQRSIPATMIFASLAATIVGPGFSIGVTSKGWSMGFLFYLLVLPYAFQTLLTGYFLAPRLAQERDCHSLGDVMRKRYGRFTHFLTGILSVGVCIGFTAVMGKIGGSILHGITGWTPTLCVTAVTGATALLTFAGGLRATVATEGLQFALKSIVIPVTLLLAVAKSGVELNTISTQAFSMAEAASRELGVWGMFGIAISFGIGEILIPPYANRALAADSQAASRSGFLLAGGFIVLWLAVVTAMGNVAREIVPASTAADDVFLSVGRAVLPAGLFGLLLAAVVAIVMSSQESVLNSAAVAFVRDVVVPLRAVSDRAMLLLAKVGTLIIAGLSILASQFAPDIVAGLLRVYAIWVPAMFVSLVAALYVREPKPLASWLSMLGGATASMAWQSAGEPHGVPAILTGLAASLFLYVVGHLQGRPLHSRI